MKLFNKISIFGLALLISCSAPVLAGRKRTNKGQPPHSSALDRRQKQARQAQRAAAREAATWARFAQTEQTVIPAPVSQPGWISRLWTAAKTKATAVAASVKSLTDRVIDAVTPTFIEVPTDLGHTGMIDQTSFAQQPVVEEEDYASAAGTGLEIDQQLSEALENHSDTSTVRSPSFDHLSDEDMDVDVDSITDEVVTPAVDIVIEEPVVAQQAPLVAIEYHPELTEGSTIAREMVMNTPEVVTLPREAMNVVMEQLFPQPQPAPLDIEYHPELTTPQVVENNVDSNEVNQQTVLPQPLQVIEDYIPAVVAQETAPTAQTVDQVIEEIVPPAVEPVVDIESQEPVAPAQQGWFSSLASFATAKAKSAANYVNQNPAEVAAVLLGTAALGKTAHTVYTKTTASAQPALETVFSIPCKEGASLQLTNDGKLTYVGTTANALHKANVLKTDIVDAKEGYVDLRTAQGSYFVRISKETVTETIENTAVEYAQYTLQLIKEEADDLWVYEDEGVELETTIKVDLANKTIVPANEQEQAQRTRVVSLITKLAAATQPAPQEAALASN